MEHVRPSLRRLAALALLAALAPATAWAQSDPYGPRRRSAPPPARDLSRVTPLLTVEDGTPRYALLDERSVSSNDARSSQMLAFSLADNMPVDAGRNNPRTTGEYGGSPVLWHYLVNFWDQWPDAKERPGRVARLGETDFTIRPGSTQPPPPPAIKRVLDAQAGRIRDAIQAYPFIQRSADVMTRVSIRYHQDKDPSGTQVWGFTLSVQFGPQTTNPVQLPDGRWRWTSMDWTSLNICTNCFSKISTPTGRYRGLQTMGHKTLVDTLAAPLWVSEYRSGQGPLIPNPEMYDRSRPATDIQILVIDGHSRDVGVAARMGPDNARARSIAATWLTDWKAVVDQANGPSAPRAD